MDDLLRTLIDVGLRDKEGRVYLACLRLGPASVMNIAKEAGINRTTAYSLIESLRSKGLIEQELSGSRIRYAAQNPEALDSIMALKQAALRKRLSDFSALYLLKGAGSIISYRQGIDGIKSCYEETLTDVRPEDYYLVISDTETWLNLDQTYFDQVIERRARLYSHVRLLLRDRPIARKIKKTLEARGQQIKILPPQMTISSVVLILPRLAVIHTLCSPFEALVIRNGSIIAVFRELYENMWLVS